MLLIRKQRRPFAKAWMKLSKIQAKMAPPSCEFREGDLDDKSEENPENSEAQTNKKKKRKKKKKKGK